MRVFLVLPASETPCEGMRACNGFPSFYWFPSGVNFPGIDGILVNGKNIYALQATIADVHRMPDAGFKKAWEAIGAASARFYNWHFVMVTDKQGLAEKELGTHLRGVHLGSGHLKVSVWGCVLESSFGPLGGKPGLGECSGYLSNFPEFLRIFLRLYTSI